MRISVIAKPGAKQTKVVQLDDLKFTIWVKEPSKEGKANEAIVKLIAKHLGVAKTKVKVIRGQSSKHKILEIV